MYLILKRDQNELQVFYGDYSELGKFGFFRRPRTLNNGIIIESR